MFLPLQLTLRPSRIYAAALAGAHGFALLGVWRAVLPLWLQTALSLALASSLIWAWREISSGPTGLRISQSGQVEVLERDWMAARITGRPVVLPWLVSLRLELDGGQTRRMSFLRDSADADDLRKLRVWLKWGAPG